LQTIEHVVAARAGGNVTSAAHADRLPSLTRAFSEEHIQRGLN
jgi:hypothetical protein